MTAHAGLLRLPRRALPGFRLNLRQSRLLVLGVSLLTFGAKLAVIATTSGTNDIRHWMDFTATIARVGPIHIYGTPIPGSLYNHPPLMGYFLEVVNAAQHVGIPVRVSIRGAASLADVITALVVFELVRRRRSLQNAAACGLLIALSPVLFTISGFHGNTDPIFTMLTLLSVYLLADRAAPAWSGVVIGLALGVKLVPIVAVPALLVYAARRGWTFLLRFCVAGALVLLVTWGPAVALEWPHLRAQVLDYSGLSPRQWGLMQFGHWAGDPGWSTWLKDSARTVVAVCALIPALAVLRRPQTVVTAVALSFTMFLTLTPAFAIQYLAWAAAATVVLGFWRGVLYNATAGALLFTVYAYWSGTFPWSATMAYHRPMTHGQIVFAVVVWATLLAASWRAAIRVFGAPPDPPRNDGPGADQALGLVTATR